MSTNAYEYAQFHESESLKRLSELLRFRSISADPSCARDAAHAAEWLARYLDRAGCRSDIARTSGNPIVLSEWRGAPGGAPTVLIYGHYDVQPALGQKGWRSNPFEPVQREGNIYARGASDDKGQLFAQLCAIEALLATRGELPVNLLVVLEGEEECGSASLMSYIEEHPGRFEADVCVVSDTTIPAIDRPAIVTSLRGFTLTEVRVHGPAGDLHSGEYGGTVLNPVQALAEILAGLHGAEGTVLVPGFYDGVLPLSAADREQIAADAWPLEQWLEETGAPEPWGDAGFSLRERATRRPTLEIVAFAGGLLDPHQTQAIIPASAWAKIVGRLVPYQDPQRVQANLCEYITAVAPRGVRCEVDAVDASGATLLDADDPFVRAAARAYRRGWKAAPFYRGVGGDIPVVGALRALIGIPVVLMGFGLDSDTPHGPNEHLSLECFRRGIGTSIAFLEEAATVHPRPVSA